jgi:hypothetical protein
MKKFIFTASTIVAFASLLTGCATLFAPKTHPLALSSEPYGAEVYLNGARMGTTPVTLDLKADQNYVVEFRKDGYMPVSHLVNTKVGAGWVILDIMGGLVPIIVDAATGAWNKLDQEAINATLYEQNN